MVNDILASFDTVDRSSLVDKVESRLVELLKAKKLNVGDSIPKELELAETLGVSRTVIREAMTRLRIMGLVETRKKKGAVISSPDIFSLFYRNLNPHILQEGTLTEIFALRLVLEVGMADLVVKNATPADIAELRQIVSTDPTSSVDQIFNSDFEYRFHSKLYEITGNDSLKKFQKMLLPVFDYVHHSRLVEQYEVNGDFVSHEQLVDLLEQGDVEAFRSGMRKHLDNHFRRLKP